MKDMSNQRYDESGVGVPPGETVLRMLDAPSVMYDEKNCSLIILSPSWPVSVSKIGMITLQDFSTDAYSLYVKRVMTRKRVRKTANGEKRGKN